MHQTETSFHKLEFGKVKLSICSNLFAFHFFFFFIWVIKSCLLLLLNIAFYSLSLPLIFWFSKICWLRVASKKPYWNPICWVRSLLWFETLANATVTTRLKRVWGGWWSSLDGTDPIPYQQKKRHNSRGLFIYTNLYLRHILLKIHKLLYNTSPTINHFRYITWNAALILVRCKSPFSWETLV